ncbi:MAG: radical SAM protein [Bacillota bacterium]
MKRIILIEPQSREDHVYKSVRMPRLGLPLLGAQLKAAGYSVSIYMGTGSSIPWSGIFDADLIGISTTTSTSREAYRMAGYLRSHNIPVVLGGIHATYMTDEALQYADYVVRGEADLTFLPLVRALEAGELPSDVPGISYLHEGAAVHNPCAACRVEMDQLPFPDLTLFDGQKPLRSIPVMTSRGCPFNCNFCSVTPMFGRRYRFRSTDSVLKELSAYRGRHVFFCDDNFTANPARSRELLHGMIDRQIGIKGWGAQVRVEVARDEELVRLMRRAGARIVYIGLESINPETLERYNKQQTVEDIRLCVRRFHQYGIRVHGMFVFGSDSDTVQTIRDTVDFALETRVDSVQFLTLTPLPGTPLFDHLEAAGRLLTREWALYDGHHAVFQPALMTPEQLQNETVKALKRFYALRHVFRNIAVTGWGSSIYRGIGWWLVRHFERKNRWYDQLLRKMQNLEPKPVPLLYRLLKPGHNRQVPAVEMPLKISLTDKQGVLYLRLRGAVSRLTLLELNKSLKGLLPRHSFHLVVNTEGLRFASDQAVSGFSRFLERLSDRTRRLQVVTAGDSSLNQIQRRRRFKLPRFELLFNKRTT